MVPGGDEGHTALLREMETLLGNLSADESIRALRDGRLEIALRPAAAPRHLADVPGSIADDLRGALQRLPDPYGKLRERLRRRQLTDAGDVLLAEPALLRQPEQFAEPRIVAEFGVRIERQVVGQQAHVVAQQLGDAPFLDAGDHGILAAPEKIGRASCRER